MAKFKIGDRVRVAVDGMRLPRGTEGVLTNGSELSPFPFRLYPSNPADGWMAVSEDEIEHAEVTPVTPKPKTIPARNLSGKHIGRVVTISTVDGIVLTAELTGVSHTSFAVGAQVKGARSYPKDHRDGLFNLDPESEVIVK